MFWYMGAIWCIIFLIAMSGGIFGLIFAKSASCCCVCSLGAFLAFSLGLSSALQCIVYIAGWISYFSGEVFVRIRKKHFIKRNEKAVVIFCGGKNEYGGCIVKYKDKVYPAVCRDKEPVLEGSVVNILFSESNTAQVSKYMIAK